MTSRENIISNLEQQIGWIEDIDAHKFPGWGHAVSAMRQAIALLKAQEPATVEPKRIELVDETKAWLDKMDAVDALGNIADICIDWDGYRTADGLGGLINEIWAYARYCADRLLKAQEPMLVMAKDTNEIIGDCPRCGRHVIHWHNKYCAECGQAVKWE